MSDNRDDDFDEGVLDIFAKKIVHGLEQMSNEPHEKRVLFVFLLLGIVYEVGGMDEGEDWKEGGAP